MAKLVFKGIKPISINSAFYRNRKLTEKARLYRRDILIQLQSQLSKVSSIQKEFNSLKHCLHVSYTFYTPNEFFFTKKGVLSHRSQDLDNCLKLLTDFLFNTKYDTDWLRSKGPSERSLYGSLKVLSNLGIDDKYIQSNASEKLPSLSYGMVVEITIKDLPEQAITDIMDTL